MGVTIRDLAEHCGLSVSAVSKALNGYSDISEATRQTVMAAVRELDYHPNAHARALKGGRSYNLGVLFSDDGLRLCKIFSGHRETELGTGTLTMRRDALEIAGRRFPLIQIDSMAMVKSQILLFSVSDSYYEIRAKENCCLRKYYMAWQIIHQV